VVIQIDEPSVDDVIIATSIQQESTSNVNAAAGEQSYSIGNVNAPERPISNMGLAAVLKEGDVRASTNSQVLMT
jgi:hypothetical protein